MITSDQKLQLYNNALLYASERRLASLTETREPRYLLDQAWDTGIVAACLEQGQWNFAMRTAKFDYVASIQPPFGFNRAFAKPADWVRTAGLCSDEFFKSPLLQYTDEAGYWFASLDSIYVRYVSDDDSYGFNYAGWPQSFVKVVGLALAVEVTSKITQSDAKTAGLKKDLERALIDAKSKDAMDEPTKFAPPGTWTSARRGPGGSRRDRGFTSGDLY